MLSSNAMVATIAFFLNWVKTVSLAIQPLIIMTDHDLGEIAEALELVWGVMADLE
jgi:hypothetical protein